MILGIVLAGGQSSRFGSDKARALFGGQPLVAHAADVLRPHVDRVLVVGGPLGDLQDLPAPGMGPLGGIAAGLDHAAGHGYDSVLTIACDMPRVSAGLVAAIAERVPSYCADAPVLGHWPAALGAHLLAHLETVPGRAVRRWAETVGARAIAADAPIANVNTREDLAAL